MVTCADTSFLFSLYGHDANTARALRWVRKKNSPVTVTAFNEYELENALRFAEFRGILAAGDAGRFLAQFAADQVAGRIVTQVCNLALVLNEARRLSATYTLKGGHRGFDILHVAGAIEIGAHQFLTFDANQARLALAEKLAVPV